MELLPGYPPDVVASRDVMVLERIRNKRVSAVIWVRPYDRELAREARALNAQKLAAIGFLPFKAVADPGETLDQFMAPDVPLFSSTSRVVDHIRRCATMFALFAPDRGAIRLDMVHSRVQEDLFHIDGLALRLFSTLAGSGLEWLARAHADYGAFERGEHDRICPNRRRIRSVPPQAIVLFKGWQYKGHLRRRKLNRDSAMGLMHRGTIHKGPGPRVSVAFHSV